MAPIDVDGTDGKHLSRIFDAGSPGPGDWKPEELGSLLGFQLAAPLIDDLAGTNDEVRSRVQRLQAVARPPVRTFGELLRHPAPPLDLLVMLKDFSKASRVDPVGRLPAEVATVLYYASIVAALVRCGQRITELDDAALRSGVAWANEQGWVDGETRELLRGL